MTSLVRVGSGGVGLYPYPQLPPPFVPPWLEKPKPKITTNEQERKHV